MPVRFGADGDCDGAFDRAYGHGDDADDPGITRMAASRYRFCAERDNPAAAPDMGSMYCNGHGVERDYRKAAELYGLAAAAGHRRAICNLGCCRYYGCRADADDGKAYRYSGLGALLFGDPNCLCKLGDMYGRGLAVRRNRAYAVKLHFRAFGECGAAENGPGRLEDAFCVAGLKLRPGRGCPAGDALKRGPLSAFVFLLGAPVGFCKRSRTELFAGGLISKTKKLIRSAEEKPDT